MTEFDTPGEKRGVGHYISLVWGAFLAMLDVAALVFGTVLVGLGAAVLLHGIGWVTLDLDLSTTAMLASGVVNLIIGGLLIGFAAEAGIGRGVDLKFHSGLEVLVGRILGSFVVGGLLTWLAGFAGDFVDGLPFPFELATIAIGAVALPAVSLVPLVALPLAWLLDRFDLDDVEYAAIYFVWTLMTMVLLYRDIIALVG
ncbi:MAG: hypothetical protein GEU79_02620 [Acidimicrobiia bacterium]|nr:hypothetical protein [Acidimicrobiia bacterium]